MAQALWVRPPPSAPVRKSQRVLARLAEFTPYRTCLPRSELVLLWGSGAGLAPSPLFYV